MDNCYEICRHYAQRVGNEVGWVVQLINDGIFSMQNRATPIGKSILPDLNRQALMAINHMQIVYLVNVFESFMQDFIVAKDGLSDADVSKDKFWVTHLCNVRDEWDSYCQSQVKPLNTSNSFMNLQYSLFTLETKYNIRYPSYLTPAVAELGSVRNCLVHHNGDLLRKDRGGYLFKDTLCITLKLINVDKSTNSLNIIDKNDYMNKVIYDLQTFIELCGGNIRRPKEHALEATQ